MKGKVIFVGAGPGDPDLITVKGRKVIENADVIIYAGSLVNKDVLCPAKDGCEIHNSAYLNLEETDEIITESNMLDILFA
jgi:precorrin-4/cobalt-precorrin-4 C11-methyltransferase